MKIFLNGKEVTFNQTDERYVSDVLIRLLPWMEQNGFFMDSIAINKVLYHKENLPELAGMEIEDVDKMEVIAYSKMEIEFVQYSVLKNYFTAVLEAIEKNDTEKFNVLAENFEEIKHTLSLNIKFEGVDIELKMDEKLKESAATIIKLCDASLAEIKKFK